MIRKLILLAGVVAMSASVASAADLSGTWLRPKTGKHVQSYSCGGGLGLRVVDTGKVIMCGAKAVGGGKYQGTLTSTEDGNQYSGTVTVAGSQLELSGCVLGGLICKNETWSRVK
ncbi:DUF2147 domain-containing protein [Hyphomicrobium sp. 99]|uniref:DUF2147 domain-containing protein n=1 Tax=Hyphomicrobium sp. 99 TaxID=1163419 RepID=UPI0005F80C8C|nr:DUF2147 domain-containing protein [Hyphomicrobium sp. 99]